MINNAVLIQHTYSNNNAWSGNTFLDMQRLTYQRHAAYCSAHNIDYWNFQGGKFPQFDGEAGSWAKVGMVRDALKDYEFVFWIDVDAAIVDFATDLRESVKDIHIGGCVHDPAKSEFLKQNKVDRHVNVGALYFRNTPESKAFVDKWYASYPGPARWAEQGAFNELMDETVTVIDDKWNATVNVNLVEKPVVMGWHGVPLNQRFLMMKEKFINDHIEFKV
jgi:hypothetical protein